MTNQDLDTNDLFICASEAAKLLECSRTNIERLQLKGKLKPVATIHPKYYFKKSDVLKIKLAFTKSGDYEKTGD